MENSNYYELIHFLLTGQFPESVDETSGEKRKALRKEFKKKASNYLLADTGDTLYRVILFIKLLAGFLAC